MRFISIRSTDTPHFRRAWSLYTSAFPPDERRTLAQQRMLLSRRSYRFRAVYERSLFVGMFSAWHLDDLLLIEHLAVVESVQGTGLGSAIMKRIIAVARLPIVLEVERPHDALSRRRIAFYERLGFCLNRYAYTQPPYGKGKRAVPMYLMSSPKPLSQADFVAIREQLHTKVYGLAAPIV